MIKATGTTDSGTPFLLLGLSGENITRLVAGEPVRIAASHMAEIGMPAMELAIHYGRTDQDIVAEFRKHGIRAPLQVDERGGTEQ